MVEVAAEGGGVDEKKDGFGEFDNFQTVEVAEEGEPSRSMDPGESLLNSNSTIYEKSSGATGVKDECKFGDFNEPETGGNELLSAFGKSGSVSTTVESSPSHHPVTTSLTQNYPETTSSPPPRGPNML